MSAKKSVAARKRGEAAGDCIDCHQCVAVCPTGIDIRNGPDLGCIQCGLCIDACDTIMQRLDRPTRLIAYDTDINIQRRMDGEAPVHRVLRPRALLYAGLIVLVGAIMAWSLSARTLSGVNVLYDRNPEHVMLADGGVRNAYTVRILNKRTMPRDYAITVVEGLGRSTGPSATFVACAD